MVYFGGRSASSRKKLFVSICLLPLSFLCIEREGEKKKDHSRREVARAGLIFSIVLLLEHPYLFRTLEPSYFGEIFMSRKVKSDDNDFHASARTVGSSEREGRMYALYKGSPHIPIKIPFIKTETLDSYAFSFLILRFRLRQGIQFLTQNIYFTTVYIFSCLAAYNHVRFYYKDQLLSYGLRRELPGIAEQVQTQSVSTFTFSTLPLALEKANTMGRARTSPPNTLARFAVTPFVNRVDVYRDAAVIQFNTKWVDLLGTNLIRQWYLKPTHTTVGDPTPTIPQVQTISSLPKEEFQSALVTHDHWRASRPFMELADELPTQLEDLFSEPTRRCAKGPQGPLELLRFFELPTLSGATRTKTRFQPTHGRELQEWLRFFSVKAAPPYELLHALPVADLSPQDSNTSLTTLNQNRRDEWVSRIAWQRFIDMTTQTQDDLLLRGLRPNNLARPSWWDPSALQSLQRRYLFKEHSLDNNPMYFRWAFFANGGKKPRRVRLTFQGRRARITRKHKLRVQEMAQNNGRVKRVYRGQLKKQEGYLDAYKKEYRHSPLWQLEDQPRPFNPTSMLFFPLTPHEVAQACSGPPVLDMPRPPRNPDDFLPVSSDLWRQSPALKKPVSRQTLMEFLQKQMERAGQGVKEGMVTLGQRLLRGGPTRRVLGAPAQQETASVTSRGGSANRILRSLHDLAGTSGKSSKGGLSRSHFRAKTRAGWSGTMQGQYLKAVYAYRLGLKRYNKEYSAPRARYIQQVAEYKQLIRQAREIRSFWQTILPMFIAQQMHGPFGTPKRFIHSPVGQMKPFTWAHAPTLADRLGRQPSSRGSMNLLLQMLSGQRTGPTPESKTLYTALAASLEEGVVYNKGLEQFADALVDQKMHVWVKDFYALLRQYNLSQGSSVVGQAGPLTIWVNDLLAGRHSFEKPIGFPAGLEYHWARTMQLRAQAYCKTELSWHTPHPRVKEALLTPQLVRAIWQKVNRETTEYLDRVHDLQVTPEDRKQFKEALDYAQLMSDIHICHHLRKEVPSLLASTLGLGLSRDYTQALSSYIPRTRPVMHGFLFPDKTYEESQKELHAAQRRYDVLKMSPWGAFKTFVTRRPFEVFLPPGWRPFNGTVFSSAEVPNVLPARGPWGVEEDPAMVPAFARPYARLSRPHPDHAPRAFKYLLDRLENAHDELLDVSYGPAHPLQTAEGKKVPSVPSMEELGYKYLLGRGNVFKDRPLSFRGQQKRFQTQPTATAPDQIQLIRAQMGLRAEHASPLYRTAGHIRRAQKKRLPLTRQGYLRRFFRRRSRKLRTADQRPLGWKKNKRTTRALRMLRRDLYPLDKAARWEERRFISRDKRESWWNWLTAPLSNGRSMLQPRVNKWDFQETARTSRQRLCGEEWDQLTEKVSASRTDLPFTLKMPWDFFQGQPVNSLRMHGQLWQPNVYSPKRLYLVSPKDRLAAVTQIMMQLTRGTPGMSNELEYSNMVATFNYFDQQERFGLRSPFVSHLVMPRHELLPEPTGAPTMLFSSTSDVFTFAQLRWTQAEQLMQQQLLQHRSWHETVKKVIDLVDKVPGVRAGKSLLRPLYYQRNYEPITRYWWCYVGQAVFLLWAFRAYRYTLKETWNEMVDILFDNFPIQPLREVMNDLGLFDPFTYRIILESPDTFSTSAGSLNKRLFYQTCEVILGLRNLRNGGRSRKYLPKGILFTGVPGTGKTYLVQMLAGAAGLPVITQTASELFDKGTVAMLGLEDSTLTPADQLGFAFDRARELAPCIFFVDEIDALGVTRASLLSAPGELPDPETDLIGYVRACYPGVTGQFTPHMSDEQGSARAVFAKTSIEELRQDDYKTLTCGLYPGSNRLRTGFLSWQNERTHGAKAMRVGTLTEFLVQMDGLRRFTGVLVIGATNRLGSIDPALVRPGRLERVIQLHPLSTRQRIDVLRRQCEKVGAAPAINWHYLANRTRGATAANLATAVNHSAVHAVRTGSLHTIETLEYGLDAMTRHKLSRQMISTRPLPKISASKAQDPFKFLRIAYYNAGRALLHTILPNHLSLSYAKLAVEPFDPDWALDELVLEQKTGQQLDSMLIGLYAGKAAEFAMLYRDTPNEKTAALLHLSESDQGAQEMAYGTELANAIVDGWYLLEEQRLASVLPVGDNETCRNTPIPVDLEMRAALDYWTETHARLFAHVSATLDTPKVDTDTKTFMPGLTIHQRHEELAFWALNISRFYMSAVSTRYAQWSAFEGRQPRQSEGAHFWVPPDLYYHQAPGSFDDFERFVQFVRPQEQKTRKNTVKNKHQRPEQWKKLAKQWDQGRFEEGPAKSAYDDLAGRQMVTFPAWHEMDRDYLLQGLVRRAFDAASLIFQDHMELLDRMATYLLKHGIIREDTIQEMLFEYTVDRYKAKLPLAIPLSKYFEPYGSYSIPPVTIHGASLPPLIGPIIYERPAGEFEHTQNNPYLVYQCAWLSTTPVKRVPLDIFEHTFNPYDSSAGWWVKQDQKQQGVTAVPSPDGEGGRVVE